MIDYAAILSRRYQGKEWTLNGDTYDGLTWLSDGAKPSKSVLDGLWSEVQAEIASEKSKLIADRQSALSKLGLTVDEITALFG